MLCPAHILVHVKFYCSYDFYLILPTRCPEKLKEGIFYILALLFLNGKNLQMKNSKGV
jgi:hypothetical protein